MWLTAFSFCQLSRAGLRDKWLQLRPRSGFFSIRNRSKNGPSVLIASSRPALPTPSCAPLPWPSSSPAPLLSPAGLSRSSPPPSPLPSSGSGLWRAFVRSPVQPSVPLSSFSEVRVGRRGQGMRTGGGGHGTGQGWVLVLA